MKPDFRLYLITDRKLFSSSDEMLLALEEALKGGVKAIQLREKDLEIRELLDLAYRIRTLTAGHDARLFINDRADVAIAVNADGVHLGGMSIPVQACRRIVGSSRMIGVSTHSLQEALQAQADGADFITLGPLYETPSKIKYGSPIGLPVLKTVAENCSLPVFGIGGIESRRIKKVLNNGAEGIALISAILTAEDVQKTTEEFMRELS